MPEIALGGLSALDAPPGFAQPARRSPAPRKRKAGPRLRKFRAHAVLVVGSAAFSAIMIGIVLNATVMQKEHHPAPLFAPLPAAAAPPPARLVAPAPASAPAVAPVAPAPIAPLDAPVAETPAAAPRPKAPAAAAHHAAPHRAAAGDAIGRLLGAPAVHGTAHPAGHAVPAATPAKAKAAPVVPVGSRPLAPPAR